MAEEEKKAPIDETGYINTEELRDVLKEKEKQKKECWLKRLFKRKDKKKIPEGIFFHTLDDFRHRFRS